MVGKFYVMSMNPPPNTHDEQEEEKQRNIKSYKKGISQRKRNCGNCRENSESVKCINLSSQMHSSLYNNCGMSQSKMYKMNVILNQSNYGFRIRHIQSNGHR